ncbi:MAG: hypothetical protein PHI34_08175 [Acidobacteriota bacterium]|nr:hypothetical protein [Acidobacteriota bacterium]
MAMLLGAASTASGGQSVLLSLSGGVHPVFVHGVAGDYEAGVNDFPVTPYHAPAWAGLGLGLNSGRWLFELEARWVAASPVTLEDPSDGDTVSFDASARLVATLGIFFRLLTGGIQPYLGAGGGFDAALAGETQATSSYGYAIIIPAPAFKDRFDPLVQAGGGIFIKLTKALSLRLDGRYVWIFEKPHPVRGVQAGGSLSLSF